jgi:hypothetical protein
MAVRILIGVTLVLVGLVWALQGLDVLGGSGMSGHIVWTFIGAIVILLGAATLQGARKLRG